MLQEVFELPLVSTQSMLVDASPKLPVHLPLSLVRVAVGRLPDPVAIFSAVALLTLEGFSVVPPTHPAPVAGE